MRDATNKILEMVEEGILDPTAVLKSALCYMSEYDVADMAECEGYISADEVEDDEDDDYLDDEEDEDDEEIVGSSGFRYPIDILSYPEIDLT